jgi:hypothetical protein
MTDDLERDLRATLDDRAGQAPPPHEAGPAVARARRRRGLTVAAGALGAAAVVVAAVLVAGALRSPSGGGAADPGPSGSIPTPSATGPTEAPSPPAYLPEQASLEHGGTVWGLYLALAEDPNDPALDDAIARAASLGYEVGVGEIACDQGAAEALAPPEGAYVVALYFETETDAETVSTALPSLAPIGIAEVTTYCLD